MSVFDVRGNGVGVVDTIVFGEGKYEYASTINKDGAVILINDHECDTSIYLRPADIPNMILALQKAVELGWVPVAKATVKTAAKPAVKK